jgi:DNA repair exonuclease SbcCD ATPase subunit/DNA repair exonuclease SbcCD nuclease subunit
MRPLRIFHTADWHLFEQNMDQVLPALRHFVEQVRIHKPDAVVIAGDLGVKRGFLTPTEIYHIRTAILDIAEICPVIIIPGNHDATNKWDKMNTVGGMLGRDASRAFNENVHLANKYEVIDLVLKGEAVRFYCLPHPSKYFYMAQAQDVPASELDAAMTKAMQDVMLGISADINDYTGIPIMVGHGTITGGLAGNEMIMTAENDLAIDREWLPEKAAAIMYGHLHRPQEVGAAVYCGPLAPLTFGEEKITPVYADWSIGDETSYKFVEIPVEHQLLTIDIPAEEFTGDNETVSIHANVARVLSSHDLVNAIVRVRVNIPEDLKSMVNRLEIEKTLESMGTHEQRVLIETITAIKVRADDIEGELTHPALIQLWSSLDETRSKYLPELLKLDTEIEALIPKDNLHLLHGIDYEIVKMSANNFKPLIDVNIDFADLGSVVAIIGPNFAGKSQVAEIERFVFWKKLRGNSNLAVVVRNGEKEGTAEIEFMAQGKTFKCTRSVKLTGKGIGKGSLVLMVKSERGWEAYNSGTGRDTQQEIEVLVGTYDMYRATRFGSQREIDLLCNMLPSALTDTLQEAVGITAYDIKKELAKGLRDQTQKDNEAGFAEIEKLRLSTATRGNSEAHLESLKANKDQAELEVNSYQTQKDAAQTELTEINANAALQDSLNTQITGFDTDIRDLEGRQANLANLLSRADSINAGVERQRVLKVDYEAAVALQSELNGLAKTLIEDTIAQREDQTRINIEVGTLTSRIDALTNQIELHMVNHNNLIENKKTQITHLKQSGELVSEVPCSGTDMNNTCSLLGVAREAVKTAAALEEELATIKEPDLTADRSELNEKTAQRSGLREDALRLEGEVNKAKETHDTAVAGRILPDVEGLRLSLSTEEAHGWEAMKQEIVVSESQKEENESRLVSLRAQREGVQADLDKIKSDPARIVELGNQITAFGNQVTAKRSSYDEYVRQIGSVEAKLEQMKETDKEIERMEKNMEGAILTLNVLTLYIAAFSRDGIPYLLLERALPRFEEYANDFLCVDAGFPSTPRVSINAQKENQTGEVREQVEISFFDDRGEHPLAEASGFQKVAIGYALRASMAKINADATGTKIKHCIFDEGWGAFDQPNIQLARQMIYKLSQWAGRFFYITHVPVLQQSAESVINVEPIDGGAKVTVTI